MFNTKNMLVPYRVGNKWGYTSFKQKIIIPCQYDRAEPFIEERAVVLIDNRWGVIDKSGDSICECQYEDISDFKNGFAQVKLDNKWGFINVSGIECIKPVYDNVSHFSEHRAAVKSNEKIAFINTEGTLITEFIYDNSIDFLNGLASVEKNKKHGCIDLNGSEVIPCVYDIPVTFLEGLAKVSLSDVEGELNPTAKIYKNYKPGILSGYEENGKLILKDSSGNPYDKELIELNSQNHRCGYINANNEIVIPLHYEMAFDFHEGLACVRKNTKFGYINSNGGWVIDNIFDDAGDFHEGFAKVMKNYKWGYINKEGNLVIECKYREANDFKDGFAKVTNDENVELFINPNDTEIDFSGVEIAGQLEKIKYFGNESFSEGFITAASEYSDYFFIDKNGKRINDSEYIEADSFKNGLARVVFRFQNSIKSGYIDFSGEEYWEEEINIIRNPNSVIIGNLEYSVYNLDVTTFRNGDIIPQAQSDEEWEIYANEGKPAWCYFTDKYNQNSAHGKLYNWHAATDIREIAPIGYRLPTSDEMYYLLRELGPGRIGYKLKSDKFWDGTNESGFNAMPSGTRCGPPTIENWEFQGSKEEEYAAFWLKCKDERPDDGVALILSDNDNFPPYIKWESKYSGLSIRLVCE